MNIDIDRKFLQLFMFAHKLALPVIRTFFVYNVLDCTEYNKDFTVYLDICKHTLYHLAVDVKCCQCDSNLIFTKATCRITMTQFLQMYTIDRSKSKHYRNRGSQSTQCMCGVTVKNTCSLQDLDLSLIHSVLKSALQDRKHNKYVTWLNMIIEQRNELCHVHSLTKWTESDIQTMWGYLQGAVLGLASCISHIPDYKESIEMQIDLLKVADYGLTDIQPVIQTIKTEIQTIKSELDKSFDPEVFGSRLDSFKQKCDENKQEIINALEEGHKEQEQLLHLIYDQVKKGNMTHHRNALEFDIKWSSEQATNENEKEIQASACKGTNDTTECFNLEIEGIDCPNCCLEWTINTHGILEEEREKIIQTLQKSIETTLHSTVETVNMWSPYKIEVVKRGSITIGTSVPSNYLQNEEEFKISIRQFLDMFVDICNINTSEPLVVKVNINILSKEPRDWTEYKINNEADIECVHEVLSTSDVYDKAVQTIADDKDLITPVATKMLKVTKLPKEASEDSIRFFLENKRKYGGGEVGKVELDKSTASAIVTFNENGAVGTVLKKIPIMFYGEIVDVEAFFPNKMTEGEKPEEQYQSGHRNTIEQETTHSVEVTGMHANTTQNSISGYFASRKGANGNILNIEFCNDRKMYIITFEKEEAVQRVLVKNHIIDGVKLQVQRHSPVRFYSNKILVEGFTSQTTTYDIINFIEATTKLNVRNIKVVEKDTKNAIVTFEDKLIDIEELKLLCDKKSFDGVYPIIQPVIVSNCILVQGFSEKTKECDLEYYFDTKRKAGVEGVTSINMNQEAGYCIICFENTEEPVIACARSHEIDNIKLKVQVFYECLGTSTESSVSQESALTVAPLIVTKYDENKVYFLKYSLPYTEELENRLQKCFAHMILPLSPKDNRIIIECTLNEEKRQYNKLVRSWSENVKTILSTFMNDIDVEEHTVLPNNWSAVMIKISKIFPNPSFIINPIPSLSKIIIVGHTSQVKVLSTKVKQIINKLSPEKSIDLKK